MVRLSGFEWLALAAALLLCPGGSPAGAEPNAASGASAPARSLFDRLDRNRDGRIGRGEFGLVGTAEAPPSAAAGGTRTPKKPE